ncbi:elongation factor Tu [Gimesia sp.]|uniref:EF-Tu C-terminal domain-related protein n=1 Tax=Gimesia sp. TaxID=2024833 RepID=UPI003A93D4A0
MKFREIEVEIRYLTTEEGGRKQGMFSGYRGQFHYNGDDFDGAQFFPDLPEGVLLELGMTVRALVRFPQHRWDEFHSKHIRPGMDFQIREGAKVVGHGVVKTV